MFHSQENVHIQNGVYIKWRCFEQAYIWSVSLCTYPWNSADTIRRRSLISPSSVTLVQVLSSTRAHQIQISKKADSWFKHTSRLYSLYSLPILVPLPSIMPRYESRPTTHKQKKNLLEKEKVLQNECAWTAEIDFFAFLDWVISGISPPILNTVILCSSNCTACCWRCENS